MTVLPHDEQFIPVGKEDLIFASPETTFGTLVKPTASDFVPVMATPNADQPQRYVEDPLRRQSTSKRDDIEGRPAAGDWGLSTLIRPSGSLGVGPEIDKLLEGLFGVETITGGTSVVYSPIGSGLSKPSLSIHWIRGGQGVSMAGCLVGTGRFSGGGGNSESDLLQVEFSGLGTQKIVAGTAEVTVNITIGGTVTVDDGQKFQVGAFVSINDNGVLDTAAGHQITDVTGNVLTLNPTPASGHTAAATLVVEPYVPTGLSEVGTAVHGKETIWTFDSQAIPVLTWSLEYTDPSIVPADLADGSTYPNLRFRASDRDVAGSFQAYSMHREQDLYVKHFSTTRVASSFVVNDPSGPEKVYFDLIRSRLAEPRKSGDEGTLLDVDIIGRASSALDDELILSFKA